MYVLGGMQLPPREVLLPGELVTEAQWTSTAGAVRAQVAVFFK